MNDPGIAVIIAVIICLTLSSGAEDITKAIVKAGEQCPAVEQSK